MSRPNPVLRRPSVAVLSTQVRDALTRVNRRLRQTRPLGEITMSQFSALQSLEAAGGLTPRELAELERVQPPTLTRIVARLEEKGLVARTRHPTDGRQVILAASAVGRAVVEQFRRSRDEWLAQRLAKLSPGERDTLAQAAEILSRLARDTDPH